MKLYNKTKYPDTLLEQLLVEAGKAVGARTTNVVVKATCAKSGYHHCYGTAHHCDLIKSWVLTGKGSRWIETDGGYFNIILPHPFLPDWVKQSESYKHGMIRHDGLNFAELIFSVASHEWQHIKQYQNKLFDFKNKAEMAKHHDRRAWEKDAIKASSKAKDKPRNTAQDAILNLALWIEENK